MKTSELKAVLEQVIAIADAKKHDELRDGDWERKTSASWARIVMLMNICTLSKDLLRLWEERELDEAE